MIRLYLDLVYLDNSVFEQISTTNLVSNAGVVASDTTGVGTGSEFLAAAGYGGDKAIFGFGHSMMQVIKQLDIIKLT